MEEAPELAEIDQPAIDRTILFSDVVASTELIRLYGDSRWRTILEHHCSILEAVASRHRGRVVKCSGDGFMVAFARPVDGVRCALRLQTAFAVQNQIPIRIGLHHGPVLPYRSDYIGLTVHLASRYTDFANGSEVVMSECCYLGARDELALPDLEKRMEFVKGVDLPQPLRIAPAPAEGSVLSCS